MTLAVTTAAVAKERWENYAKSKIWHECGLSRRPLHRLDAPPDNGDGQRFHTADGRAELAIYGAWKANDDTPKSYVENYVEESGAGITYRQITDHFFVVSGTKDGKIFYQRCNF